MSRAAEAMRSSRQSWAAAGGTHDRLVRALQLGLPALAGALMAVMVFAPFSKRGEISFLLAKDSIEVTQQRIEVREAVYRGEDAQRRPFTLSAQSAVQRSAADPVVRMRAMNARIIMAEGPATLSADAARYDPRNDSVMVDGPLRFATSDGFRLNTANVLIDLRRRTLSSQSPASGQLPFASFSGGQMAVDLDQRVIRLTGGARLRINQGAL